MQLLKILTFLILCDTYFHLLCLLGEPFIIQLNICTAKAIVFDSVTFFLENCLLTYVMENCSTARSTRNGERLLLLFDFTHIIKNISNIFLRRSKMHISSSTLNCVAQFSHIKRLYALEEFKTLKVAFVLTKVSLNPSSLSRTSPLHALNKLVWSRKSALLIALYSVSILLI